MLEVLLILSPSRFFRAIREDAQEFLTTCKERLYTLDLVESKGVNFIAYQLDGLA